MKPEMSKLWERPMTPVPVPTMTDNQRTEMTAIKRLVTKGIKAANPILFPFCHVESWLRNRPIIVVGRPTYPEPDPRLEEYLHSVRCHLDCDGQYQLRLDVCEGFCCGTGEHGVGLRIYTCEQLEFMATANAYTIDGHAHAHTTIDDDRLEWPESEPLPANYWEHRQHISDQFQLMAKWVELNKPACKDDIPELDDLWPSMLIEPVTPPRPHGRTINDEFVPAW